jgi:hypothetical protein
MMNEDRQVRGIAYVKVKVKKSRYKPWTRLGGEEI